MSSKALKYITIVLTVFVGILMFRECSGGKGNIQEIIVVKKDTIYKYLVSETPKPIETFKTNWRTNFDTLWKDVDSSNIIDGFITSSTPKELLSKIGDEKIIEVFDDYFSKKVYTDTITGDDISIITHDTVYMNTLYSRNVYYKNLRESKLIIKDNTENKLLLGGFLGGSKSNFDFGIDGGFKTKKDIIFMYQYGIITKSHRINLVMPLGLKQNN